MTRVRSAWPGDAKTIGAIHVETWRDSYAGVLPDDMLLRMSAEIEGGRWARILHGGEAVLVAETDAGRVVAFGSCGPARRTSLDYAGEVYTLYVHPDFQDQGIGRRLLRALFGALEKRGYRSAVIWVLQVNPSRYFYQTMGGRHVADRDGRLWGVVLPEAAYGWDRLCVPCSPR